MIKLISLKINNEQYVEYATIPAQSQDTLDESLDLFYVELVGMKNDVPFKPFSDIEIKIKDSNNNEVTYYYFIQSDNVTHVVGKNYYNHDLLLIEETKWLERFFVDKTITQPFIHDYIRGASLMIPTVISAEAGVVLIDTPQNYISPQKVNTYCNFVNSVTMYSGATLLSRTEGEVISPTGQTYDISNTDANLLLTEGTWTIHYEGWIQNTSAYIYEYQLQVIEQPDEVIPYTIRDTLDKLLWNIETLRLGEYPRFTIAETYEYTESSSYRKEVQKIFDMKSPEFSFARMSLWEALKTVGDYAHFIPRLRQGKIYLDLLGLNEIPNRSIRDDFKNYCAENNSQSIEQFCNGLDSIVNNLVSLDDIEQGSITTPFDSGYRTLRTTTGGVQITEDNMIIPTEEPIEKIIKLEIGYLQDGENSVYVGDITPYVYENTEYNVLSSYGNIYPYAKKYAIKYTIGEKNITGLNFERQNIISQAFESIAIKNIIFRKLNIETDWLRALIDNIDTLNIQYRLTYIPSITTRVKQSKANKEDISSKEISIAYNQSASKISSNAYGESMKGAIAKYGNVAKIKVYIFPSLDLIPKCGQMFDEDYMISVIKCEYYANYIKCELGLSKNYNNKNAYVEIDSQIRFYEISERLAQNRFVIYEDYCEVGDGIESDNNCLITELGLNEFIKPFSNEQSRQVGYVALDCYDKNHQYIDGTTFVMPVMSLGIGNSLLFSMHFEDNYSAGNIAYYDGDIKVQEMKRYTDFIGEINEISYRLGYSDEVYNNYAMAVGVGNNVPSYVPQSNFYFNTMNNDGDYRIIIDKDNRETIHFTYQIHFVSNRKNLIIGSALTRKSVFTTNEQLNYKLYILPNKINKLTTKIDLTNAVEYGTTIITNINIDNSQVTLNDVIANANGEAYAICQDDDLIVGENISIQNGDIIHLPNFTFKRKIV